MNSTHTKVWFLMVSIILIYGNKLISQNSTSSPYSSLGIGELQPQGIGVERSMGGLGIALRPTTYFNHVNPASNSALIGSVVKVETGVFYKYSLSQEDQLSSTTNDVNLNYFTLTFPTQHKYTFSLGLKPYSSVGYRVVLESTIEGTENQYLSVTSGEGGINQIFLGNALKVNERLSLGINLSLLWGNVIRKEELYLSSITSDQIISENERSLWGGKVDYGFQYTTPMNERWSMRIGGVIEQPIGFSGTSSDRVFSVQDDQVISESDPEHMDISFPYGAGLGVSFEKEESWVMGLDMYYQRWKEGQLWENNEELKNSLRISGGIEYTPKKKRIDSKPRISYRMGAFLTDTYIKVEDTPIWEYGISMGIGVPFQFTGSMNIGYEYSRKGTTNESIISENNHLVTLSFTLPDIWFIKKVVD